MRKVLNCECGNDTDFYEETMVCFTVDSEGNREEKMSETTRYFCDKCGKRVYWGN